MNNMVLWSSNLDSRSNKMSKQLTWLEYYQTTVHSFGEKSKKQIPSSNIFESTGRC